MRMSDTVDTETMKVSEAADTVSSPKDNSATKSEVTDQKQSGRDDHGSNNKRDAQVKKKNNNKNSTRFMFSFKKIPSCNASFAHTADRLKSAQTVFSSALLIDI